jgi:TolB protein
VTPYPVPSVVGTIAFAKAGELAGHIYSVRTDGTELTPLTNAGFREEDEAAWSPDGSQLAFIRGDTGSQLEGTNFKVWLMNADGSGQRRLFTDKTAGVGPAWSPDGRKIVFSRWFGWVEETYEIATVNTDGSDLTPVIRGSNYLSATWAPDGRVFWLLAEKQDVYSVRPDGSDLKRVTRLGDVFSYALSPDGTKLAVYQGYPRSRIAVVTVEGPGKPTVVVKPLPDTISSTYVGMSWSPDGKALAFASESLVAPPGELPGSSLYVVNADGSGLSMVPNTGRMADPAWRPE